MQKTYSLTSINDFQLETKNPALVFLYGDLWAGKTTLVQNILSRMYWVEKESITSPTYVYYNKYNNIYHFDLYRLQSYDEFVSIWWEETLDNNEGLILIEWPEIIEEYYKADAIISIRKCKESEERIIEVQYRK